MQKLIETLNLYIKNEKEYIEKRYIKINQSGFESEPIRTSINYLEYERKLNLIMGLSHCKCNKLKRLITISDRKLITEINLSGSNKFQLYKCKCEGHYVKEIR